jgi:hypothetical protein
LLESCGVTSAGIRRTLIALLVLTLTGCGGSSPPPKPVSGREWKAVLNDWYDGRMDGRHRCAAVREAIRHLPSSPPMYSSVYDDLEAYAKKVC